MPHQRVVRYEPKDDVDARGLYDEVVGNAASAAVNALFLARDVAPGFRWSRLGVLQRVLELGFPITKSVVYMGCHDVQVLLRDADWLDAWGAPARVKLVLDSISETLNGMRAAGPKMLRRETLLPPRVLAAIQKNTVRRKGA